MSQSEARIENGTVVYVGGYPAIVQGHGVMPQDSLCERYRGMPAYRVRYYVIDEQSGRATGQLEDHDSWVIESHAQVRPEHPAQEDHAS